MRILLALLAVVPLLAQDTTTQNPAPPPAPAETAAPAPVPGQTQTAEPGSPVPSSEPWLTGNVDFGYRWVTGPGGNFDAYRSIINLGQGPRLFGLDLTIQDPKKRLFDRLNVRGTGWGGDPYTTANVDASKNGLYDFRFDYRNIAYFNALPSFANPNAPNGFDEQAYQMRRRMSNFALDFLPQSHIIPYLAFDQDSGYGNGISTWLQDASDVFAVPTLLRDSTNNYRGGVRFEYNKFHVTLEEGGTTFKDDDQASNGFLNGGNLTTPLLGQTLQLSSLQQAYGVRGNATYTHGMFTATPASWISFSGQFMFSQPQININYTDAAGGNLLLTSALLFYGSETALGTGTAEQPHVTANGGFDMRPLKRLRIVESWMTDRYHDAAFGLFEQLFVPIPATSGGTAAILMSNALANQQVVNYNQNEVDAMYDLTSKLTLRGGYRYIWGDATVLGGQLSQTGEFVSGNLQRHVGIGGVSYRPTQKLSATVDFEGASSDNIYFRTSLNDYQKLRAQGRYQATSTVSLQANFTYLNNQNPAPGINYSFESRDSALTFFWTPGGGKRFTVTGEYDRSTLNSNIGYLSLPFLNSAISNYVLNAHTATSMVDINLPGYNGMTAKLTLGGSLFVATGSRPTSFYEPLVRLAVPVTRHVSWNTEWQYYGVGEAFYLYEGFRAHIFQTGLRLSR